jgi:hypothetical protein
MTHIDFWITVALDQRVPRGALLEAVWQNARPASIACRASSLSGNGWHAFKPAARAAQPGFPDRSTSATVDFDAPSTT